MIHYLQSLDTAHYWLAFAWSFFAGWGITDILTRLYRWLRG
jgi:hypothetical protein